MYGKGKKIDLLILTLFNIFIGEFFYNNGDRCEGEWKDGNMYGQGKKSDLLILTLFNIFVGKFF